MKYKFWSTLSTTADKVWQTLNRANRHVARLENYAIRRAGLK